MSKIGKYFSSTHPGVKKLLKWKQSDIDEKWATKAIDSLVKKLKKRKNSLENLEYALSNPNCPSICVIITKNSDGRLQVMHRKELTHVIYCRIWRWPDLVSHHELMSTDTCGNPFSPKNSEICVNPYHYRRLGSPTLPPILVPHQSQHQTVQLPMQSQQPLEPRLPYNVSYGSDGFSISTNNNNSNNNAKCNYHNDISNIEVYNNELMNYNTQSVSTNIEFSNYNNQIGNYTIEGSKNDNGAGNMNYRNEYNNLSNINNGYFSNENKNCNTEQNFYNVEPKHYNAVSLGQLDNSNATLQNGMSLMDLQNVNNFSESLSQVQTSNNYYDYGNVIQTDLPSMQMNNCSNTLPFTPVNYSEPKYWASIAYYELNNRVGEIYQCELTSIIVDGFTNPHGNSNRFCLGKLSNVKRNSSIENTRRHIGKGLGLHYLNGELIAECLSDSAIFTQSRNCNHFNNFHSNTVCKIQPGCNLKIFSNEYFAQLLRQSVHYGFDAVYELTKMCTIRMSFVKGWGAEYQRQDVTSTPCWIEIHLNGPLQWIDQVLNQMGPSIHRISSVS